MRKMMVCSCFVFISFAACSSKATWSSEQKDAFFEMCYNGTASQFEPDVAENYCNCMLEKIMEKYPDPESIDDITMEEMHSYAFGCL